MYKCIITKSIWLLSFNIKMTQQNIFTTVAISVKINYCLYQF